MSMTENEANMSIKYAVCVLETIGNGLTLRNENDRQDACVLAIQALEKQIPKKVYHFTDDDTFETSCCGTDVTNKDYRYCPECGQLLGGVEEVRNRDGE